MDQRERIQNHDEALRCLTDRKQADMWTAMPGIIQSYDAAKMTCEVQVAIQQPTLDKTGKVTQQTISMLTDCPVHFPGGGGFCATFPIAKGDECLVVFASRCIDAWWQQGGVQPPMEYRMHDLSDGFVVPVVFSQPNVLANVSANTAQLRNKAGDTYVEVTADQKINLVAPGGVFINGVKVGADRKISTFVEATADGGHTLTQHTHSDPQGGSVGLPTG